MIVFVISILLKLVKSFDFQFGFCIPGSTNTWDAVYSLPPLSSDLSKFKLFRCVCLSRSSDIFSERHDRESLRNALRFFLFCQRQTHHAQQGCLQGISCSFLFLLFYYILFSISERTVPRPRRVMRTSSAPRVPRAPRPLSMLTTRRPLWTRNLKSLRRKTVLRAWLERDLLEQRFVVWFGCCLFPLTFPVP
jgi:hypothetical protein